MAPPTRTPRESWIEEGLRTLARGGPDAVRIEPMAKALGVTKGGFYGHFGGRKEFLKAMLDSWELATTEETIERVGAADAEAGSRLRRLFELTSGSIVAIDLAVRDWARRDEAVAERVRRIDARRMDYLRSLFAEICSGPDEVEARTMLAYSLLIGNRFIQADPGSHSRDDLLDLALRHLEAEKP
ncbi:MAG: TetR/AcrR family transcriptional regulator [Solirubrobacterales bacterium]|nr:TetR/AcrR family transcriptional regulator [Solirubrobacterales bacterium]OJU93359.1 MAG: TetR family transcriptional regulator [Solirubrobacterales bacterium 67-14]